MLKIKNVCFLFCQCFCECLEQIFKKFIHSFLEILKLLQNWLFYFEIYFDIIVRSAKECLTKTLMAQREMLKLSQAACVTEANFISDPFISNSFQVMKTFASQNTTLYCRPQRTDTALGYRVCPYPFSMVPKYYYSFLPSLYSSLKP